MVWGKPQKEVSQMKKLLSLALSILLVGGTAAPALAYGPGVAAAALVNPQPVGTALSEEALAEYEGKGLPPVLVYYGGRALVGAVTGAVVEYVTTGQVTWQSVVGGALGGIGSAFTGQYFPTPRR